MAYYSFALCKGRHEMPVDTSIFSHEINPLDLDGMHMVADETIPADATEVAVYVTGLTVALVEVIKVCISRQIGLTAMHYDRESGSYYAQRILS